MNTHYNVEEWAAGTTRGRQVFNYNYRMLGTEFKGWKLLKVVTLREDRVVTEKAYIWQSESDPEYEMIRVDITEHHNWRKAQESLHVHLVQCMRPDIPRGTKKLAQLGDVNFVSREPHTDVPSTVSFTRGNLCISVSSVGEKNVDVSNIGARVDGALSGPPAESEVETGRVRALTPKMATVAANKAHVVIENLQKSAPRGRWLKIIVPDGELSRKGNALIYVSSQGGRKRVETFAADGN
jgi:hypothetical protein